MQNDIWLSRFARFVLRHRRATFVSWVVLFLVGAFAASHVSNRLTVDFSLPGQPGYETARTIDRLYGNGGQTPPTLLAVTAPRQLDRTRVDRAFAGLRRSAPTLRVVPGSTTRDGRTTFAYVFSPLPKSFTSAPASKRAEGLLRRALPAGYTVQRTGLQELSDSGSDSGPGVFAETMFGALGALAVLAFVFASLLALVPLLIAAVSILTTLLVVLGLTYVASVSFIVQFLVALVGLGVAIDYSLLVVTRWREERAHGRSNEDAVVVATATAGHAVLLSGLTVAIGLVALIVLPVPGLRSVGYGGMLIPLVSVTSSLTLLPALLGSIGPRVDWPRVRRESSASRPWTWWARLVVRHRFVAAGVGVAALVLLLVPVFGLTTGQTSADALAKSGPAHAAYQRLLDGGVPDGALTPMEVLVQRADAATLPQRLAHVDGIADVVVPHDGDRGGKAVVLVVPQHQTVNNTSLAVVRATRDALDGAPGIVGIAGEGPIELDYEHAVFGSFPLMFSVIALLTFLLLARAFRSVLLAAKALVFNLLSMAATFGLMTWFWQEGHGSNLLFGIPATGAITFWIPLMVFAFLFGLSMDYEVFILTRVREEYDRTGSTTEAIVEGIGRTGRLVTSAALILFLAFASLASAPNTDLKVLATGLGAGILLDATIVRALLLPALVAVFGKANWWFPSRMARALRASPEAG
ncbi:MAG TPA: MMPL family transporter [Gaiellaceae bacterium]|nr:MMPL family transporter [Gaiellaceae bacterium]